MATSLQSQLKRLETPATSQLKDLSGKGRPSFLYSFSEAGAIDCDTHYAHCLSGLETLSKSHPDILDRNRVSHFKTALFSESSKSFERGVRSKEENELLDTVLEDFIWSVITPCFLQESCHKMLEYLIYKYHVNEYNIDALIVATLPYHETNLFAKLLQTLPDFKKRKQDRWHMVLTGCQKNGVHLPKSSLIQACISNPWILSELSEVAAKKIKTGSGNHVFVSFTASVFIGVINLMPQGFQEENAKKLQLQENILSAIIGFIESGVKCLKSQQVVLAAYAVAAMLSCGINIQPEILTQLLEMTVSNFKYSFKEDIREHYILVLSVMVDNQDHYVDNPIPKEVLDVLLSKDAVKIVNERSHLLLRIQESLISRLEDEENIKTLEQLFAMIYNSNAAQISSKIARSVLKKIISMVESGKEMDSNERMTAFLLVITLISYEKKGSKIDKRLASFTMDAKVAVDAIDRLTLIDSSKRLAFDIKAFNWRTVLIILEVFSKSKGDFSNANLLSKACIQLLSESFVVQDILEEDGEDADCEYFRLLLIRVIFKCIDCRDFSMTAFELEKVMESMRFFRKKESVMETKEFIKKMILKCKTNKSLQRKMLDNLMILAAASFGSSSAFLSEDESQLIVILDDLITNTLVPCYGSSISDEKVIVDTVMDSLYDVLPHRRIPLVDSFLSRMKHADSWLPYFVLSLVNRSLSKTGMEPVKKFYRKFASQLLCSRMTSIDSKGTDTGKSGADVVLSFLVDLVSIVSGLIGEKSEKWRNRSNSASSYDSIEEDTDGEKGSEGRRKSLEKKNPYYATLRNDMVYDLRDQVLRMKRRRSKSTTPDTSSSSLTCSNDSSLLVSDLIVSIVSDALSRLESRDVDQVLTLKSLLTDLSSHFNDQDKEKEGVSKQIEIHLNNCIKTLT